MVLDGEPAIRSKWKGLGGKLWMGDISPNAQGKSVQDVKITGIPLNARLAIKMVRCNSKRVMFEAQKGGISQSSGFLSAPCAIDTARRE